MRKREIHSVAHWAMMFLLLMFPLLMVGISGFAQNDNNNNPSLVLVSSESQLEIGETYKVKYNSVDTNIVPNINNRIYFTNPSDYIVSPVVVDFDAKILSASYFTFTYYSPNNYMVFYDDNNNIVMTLNSSYSFQMNFVLENYYLIGNYDYAFGDYISNYSYSLSYRAEVNKWIDVFIDLPINSWYKSLMNVVGVGFTNSSVMNVIYVMPVYILWVFIFDVIVDCFLVIIMLPHKLLNRLSGGENE